MEEVLNYIKPELVILVVFLYVIGLFLKKSPSFKTEWQIPFILLAIGVIFTVLWICIVNGEGFMAPAIISAVVQGVLIAGMAVFGNELIKQWSVKRLKE